MELTARPRGLVQAPVRTRAEASAAAPVTPQLEDLWDRHAGCLYSLACALLGDEAAAVRAVTLAMVDLARTPPRDWPEDVPRHVAARVYWRSRDVAVEPSGLSHLPPVMTWLAQLAQLQRACLALCAFGGHTQREAADLLDVPPATVAELLTAGLRELGHLASEGTATA